MTLLNVIPFPVRRTEAVNAQGVTSQQVQKEQPNNLAPTETSASPLFNIQDYLPKGERIQLLEQGKGVQIIPHKIFEFMVKATDTRVELAVFACLIRYSLGFRRTTCEASNSFIAEWTGLSPTTVRRGLEGLLDKQLIKCLKVGVSFRDRTIYEIPVIKGYLESSRLEHEDSPSNEFESTQLHHQGAQYSTHFEENSANRGSSSPPTEGDKKHNRNKTEEIKNTNSSSDSSSGVLRIYFENIQSKSRRLRELKHFESLKQRKSIQEISDSLEYLLKNGTPGNGERCYAPMAFLACSIDIVLSYVHAQQKKFRNREAEIEQEKEKKRKEEQEAEEDRQFACKANRFYEALPTEELRNEYFARFIERYPVLSGTPSALKNFAISEWASQNNI